jgi:hypothetical protein
MRRNSTSSLGALHPVLFFIFIYGISLFLALFVCRTVYYSVNSETRSEAKAAIQAHLNDAGASMNVAALK